MAQTVDEGRGKLRYAQMRCKQPLLVWDFRMGEPAWGYAHASRCEHIAPARTTQGTETSKYLEEKKSTEIALVAASERARA